MGDTNAKDRGTKLRVSNQERQNDKGRLLGTATKVPKTNSFVKNKVERP